MTEDREPSDQLLELVRQIAKDDTRRLAFERYVKTYLVHVANKKMMNAIYRIINNGHNYDKK